MNRHHCSIVACARWETASITEWLTYHAAIGFDHVYLYCNDDDPAELFAEVLPFTLGQRPLVTFRHFPFQGQQRLMYSHFLRTALHESTWVTFLDIDEFLYLHRDANIGAYLERVAQGVDAIYINWLMFGNSGHVERSPGSVLEQLTRHEPALHPFTKIIVRSKKVNLKVLAESQVHFWHEWPDAIRKVNVFGDPVDDYYVDFPTRAAAYSQRPGMLGRALGEAVICHFCLKSEADFDRRVTRGIGGEFGQQTSWAERRRSGEYKALLERLNAMEFVGLRDRWRQLRGRAANLSVVGPDRGPNLALGRAARQSSVSPWSVQPSPEADAAGAVSGAITGRYQFHTAEEDSPWWEVDLGAVVGIREIRLYNRLDVAPERARHLRFSLSGDGVRWFDLFHKTDDLVFGGIDGFPLRWVSESAVHGRHLRITLTERGFLHLDQVEVYG